jgi:hypothetical protein
MPDIYLCPWFMVMCDRWISVEANIRCGLGKAMTGRAKKGKAIMTNRPEYTPTPDEKRVIAWLRDKALAVHPEFHEWPVWRSVLWALLHPVKWEAERAEFYAYSSAARAIEQGHHHDPE